MKRKLYTLLTICIAIGGSMQAQSRTPLNSIPGNVKIYSGETSKYLTDMTFYNADNSNNDRYIYTYDETGKRITELYQYWDEKTNAWKDHAQYLYTYEQDTLTETITQSYIANTWKNLSRRTYHYENGKLANDYDQMWVDSISDWGETDIHITYSYNENGQKTLYQDQRRDENGEWRDPFYQVKYSYTESGTIQEEASQMWYETLSSWVDYDKYTYIYDASKLKMDCQYYKWDSKNWVAGNKSVCQYDAEGDLTRCDYYADPNEKKLNAYCIYTYSNTLGINDIEVESALTVYPNPADSYTEIKVKNSLIGQTASLYDSSGKMLWSQTISSEITHLSVANFTSGIYFLKIGTFTKKIIKK